MNLDLERLAEEGYDAWVTLSDTVPLSDAVEATDILIDRIQKLREVMAYDLNRGP